MKTQTLDPVIYQIFLRAFTPEGTLAAAEKYLPQIAQTGADIVYLTPVAYADRSMDKSYWSPRHLASGFDNPCSPYRIEDYGKIDPEYGTAEDLRSFINAAHGNDLKVFLDLVYYHAGPTFAANHPDWVDINGEYSYPRLKFENPALRKYLIENMLEYVAMGADGFRCDAADSVPLDFWQDAADACRAVKEDLYMLCEGEVRAAEDQRSGVFQANYSFSWSYALYDVFTGKASAQLLENICKENGPYTFVRAADNHDIAHDTALKGGRLESVIGSRGMDAVLFLNYMMDGIPFLYNGVEICDTATHNIFAFSGTRIINWQNNSTRIDFLQMLAAVRKELSGEVEFLRKDDILQFKRGTHTIIINCTGELQKTSIPAGRIVCFGNVNIESNELLPYGFLLIQQQA